jgi:hypothetical protein
MQHWIKANMEDGNYIVTAINGTREQIEQYYIGKPYIYEDVETGKETGRTRFTSVEFLD